MEKRYRALRFIGTLYKIFGILNAILSVLAVIGTCVVLFTSSTATSGLSEQLGASYAVNNVLAAVVAAGLVLVVLGGLALTLYAIGEAAYLAIALEENTRATAMYMQYQMQQQQYAQQQHYQQQQHPQPQPPQQAAYPQGGEGDAAPPA